MNKHFFFCAALLLQVVLFSCKEEVDTTETAGNAVGFSASSVNDASRAAVLETGGVKDAGFRVSAYFTGASNWVSAKDDANTTPGFMYDQLVTWSTGNNAWEYTPIKYWPKEADGASLGKVSFFAWSANAGATPSVNTEAGAPALTVTVPNTQADQKDLVTDVVVDETSETVTSTGGVVPFEFSHILSRIGFKAVKEQGQGETVITSLKVRYAANAVERKGIYTFGKTDPWTPDGSTYMSNSAGDEVVTGSVTVSGEVVADAVRVNGDDRYLMLLPQEVKAGAVLLDVSWTVGGTPHTYTVILPRQVWSPGKCHDYNLIVGQTGVALGAVAVNPWDGENLYQTFYTITYDANGGSGDVVKQQVVTNVAYPLDKNTFTSPSADALFDGWNTKSDGSGEDYREGDSFMSASDAPVTLYAQWAGVIDLSTEKAPAGVTYNNPVFNINSNGKYTVINSTTNKRIAVAEGVTCTVTLSGASINISTSNVSAFTINANAKVTMKLSGTNTLKSTNASNGQAGVEVTETSSLTIRSATGDGTGTEGILNTEGYCGAGIGSNQNGNAGAITINGGTIYAHGIHSAGMGGGLNGANGSITINGGYVEATSQAVERYNSGPGIGGYTSVGTITIAGGTVRAICKLTTYSSSGIGTAHHRESSSVTGTLNISGGSVYAQGGGDAAGIGGGNGMPGITVNISGGYVEAVGGLKLAPTSKAPCIGGGYSTGYVSINKNIGMGSASISGGFVFLNATGTDPAMGVTSGGECLGSISITGGTVVSPGGYIGAFGTGSANANMSVGIDSKAIVFAKNVSSYATGSGSKFSAFSFNETNKTITLTGNLTIPSGATFTVPAGWTLELGSYAITNNGTVECGANTAGVGGVIDYIPGYGKIEN